MIFCLKSFVFNIKAVSLPFEMASNLEVSQTIKERISLQFVVKIKAVRLPFETASNLEFPNRLKNETLFNLFPSWGYKLLVLCELLISAQCFSATIVLFPVS